ncbi:MAG: hypothetical protein ACT4QC_08905 [Planctomycetaceae bacterium]
MVEILFGLMGLCVVLGVLAVVGHALWAGAAAIFRALTGQSQGREPRGCEICGAPIRYGATACPVCGWVPELARPSPVRALERLEGQLERLRRVGAVDAVAFERLNDVLQSELTRLRQWAAQAKAGAAPQRKEAGGVVGAVEPARPVAQPVGAGVESAQASPRREAPEEVELATEIVEFEDEPRAAVPSSQPVTAESAPHSWAEMLAGFMEEHNLRWGELVGGLLIVCGSIALVLSFWAQIAQRPFLKFFVFNGFTAGLFALGAYADQRLRLPTTSRGFFSIATLLVPLNFLALAAFSRDATGESAVTIAGEVASVALFAFLTFRAGQTITPQGPRLLALGVVGPSIVALLVRRCISPDSEVVSIYVLSLMPLALYLISAGSSLWRLRSGDEPAESEVYAQWRLLGATTFAALVPIGVLAVRTETVAATLRLLAPLVSLAALPGLAGGLMISKRVASPERAGTRTVASAIALAALFLLLAGIVLAWPHPTVMLIVCLVNFGVLTAVALTQSLPVAHLLALPCLGLAYLIAVHIARHELGWALETPERVTAALLSAASGTALMPLAAFFAGAAAWLVQRRRDDGRFYALAAGITSLVSLALAAFFGLGRPGDPGGATVVFGAYAIALIAAAVFIERHGLGMTGASAEDIGDSPATTRARLVRRERWARNAAWWGAVLLLVAFVQGFVFRLAGESRISHPWLFACLAHATSLTLTAVVVYATHELAAKAPLDGRGVGGGGAFPGQITLTPPIPSPSPARGEGSENALLPDGPHPDPLPEGEGFFSTDCNAAARRGGMEARSGDSSRVARVFANAAVVTSLAAAARLVWLAPTEAPTFVAVQALWLSMIWFSLLCLLRSHFLFTAFQAALTGSVVFGVAAGIATRPWAGSQRSLWLDPWSWQIQGIALCLVGLGWVLLRLIWQKRETVAREGPGPELPRPAGDSPQFGLAAFREFVLAPGLSFDRLVGWGVLAGLLAVTTYGALPGVAQELSPRSLAVALEQSRGVAVPATGRVVPALGHFELAGLPHAHALEWGSWALLALVVLLFLSWQHERFKVRYLGGALIALATGCLLVAGRWEADVACASALRWVSAIFLALVSAGIWLRKYIPLSGRLAAAAQQTIEKGVWNFVNRQIPRGFRGGGEFQTPFSAGCQGWPAEAASRLTALVLVVAAAPVAAMALFVGTAAVWNSTIDAAVRTTFYALLAVGLIAVPIGMMLRGMSGWWLSRLPLETVAATAAASRRQTAGGLRQAGLLLWILGIAPVLATVFYIVSAALRGNPIVGPEPATFFHSIGRAASNATPVTLCALVLVGYALREGSAGFGFAAGLLFNVSATAAYLLVAARGGLKLDASMWVRLAHLNAIVSAVYALCWMAAARLADNRRRVAQTRLADETGQPLLQPAGMPIPGLLVAQALIGVALTALWMVPGFLTLAAWRESTPALVEMAAPLGRGAWFLTLTAVVVLGRLSGMRFTPGAACAALWSLAMMATFLACGFEQGNALGFRTMLTAHAAAAWLLLAIFAGMDSALFTDSPRRPGVSLWTSWLGLLTVLLAVRDVAAADRPWAGLAAISSISLLAAALGAWTRRRGFLYVTGALASLAETIWWLKGTSTRPRIPDDWPALVCVNVAAWFVPAAISLLIERWLISPAEDRAAAPGLSRLPGGLGFHRVAGVAALVCLAWVSLLGLAADAHGATFLLDGAWRWTALAAAAGIVVLCLWDAHSMAPVLSLYVLGLVASAVALDACDLTARQIFWRGTLILAAYALATSLLWRVRKGLLDFAARLRIACEGASAEDRVHDWLVPATVLLAIVVLVAGLAIDLRFAERSLRLATGVASLWPALAIGLLARPGRDDALRMTSLAIGIVATIVLAWAWLDPLSVDALYRLVVLTAALAATAVVGLGLIKRLAADNAWSRAVVRILPVHCGLIVGSVLLVVGYETSHFVGGREVDMAWPAIVVMSLTILGLCGLALAAALIPGRDPLALSERGRTVYVYAAEALLGILFLHVRITMPWLFHGFFLRYWPFIVMLVAFAGVGFSELFRRQKRFVLAEPLERTGALLPVLPVVAFSALPPESNLTFVLLTAAIIYAVLSIFRESFGFALVAALAANGGLWHFLHDAEGYRFLEHPQLWLIPFALCVVGAAYLHRDQLSDRQMTNIRYLASITIYVSSTADIFLNGVAQAPWLPVVLAGWSIVGIFAGILLRVRAFLFLGTAFLTLAMLTIIWHAAVDLHHTWLVWLTVVIAGILILATFALFEKKRQEVLRVVDDLRHWSP